MGFINAPIQEVATTLTSWRREIHGRAQSTNLDGGLRQNIGRLEPLTGRVRPRELVVATTARDWTAVLDCGVRGGDPSTTVGYLTRRMETQGVVIVSVPDVAASPGMGERWGTQQFELFAPTATEFLNYVRTISVTRDQDRWRFDANGTVQDFEQVDAYKRRRIADRLTPGMLADYAAAFGLRPFDEDFFSGPCVLVTNPTTPPPGAEVLTIREAQAR